MQDCMALGQGLDAPYGRSHKDIKVSEKVYAEDMAMMEYKITNYYGQATLYMHSGAASSAALTFFNRDGVGFFDVPELERYFDPKAVHDVWVLPFDYDPNYALALIARAQEIYNRLQAGEMLGQFARNPLCFPCSVIPAEILPAIAGGETEFIIPPGPPLEDMLALDFDTLEQFDQIVANFTTTDPTF
jgi:hypothetical protein